ncbi:protein phosphatase [Streptomyces mangrovisoli]|uniref:Protein phosphatase n=1 Tax=Streptomyces mangrovisoli TaxID=1428628 RepID=A0A1J4NWA8_9ACTN|nr:protein phosphatase [Streptomyces mangrovisoli]
MWGTGAITYKLTCPLAQEDGLGARLVSGAVLLAVGTGLICHVRRALVRELRQARRVAGAAQNVLLRPLPPRVGLLSVAAVGLPAERGASVGGDLYEAIATEHGVRVLIGDVRGHGLAALGAVAAVLGSFREAAYDEAPLGGVLRRLDRALARHLRERAREEHPARGPGGRGGADPANPVAEEFVTVLLLEIRPEGDVYALNCGHPWPYLLGPDRVGPLEGAEPLPPLGPFPLPVALGPQRLGRLGPGEALFLYTDGVGDARDAHGRFFPLPEVLGEAVRGGILSPQAVLRVVFPRLLRHTGPAPDDDMAAVVLHNDRIRNARSPAPPATEPAGHRAHRVT